MRYAIRIKNMVPERNELIFSGFESKEEAENWIKIYKRLNKNTECEILKTN